ncbi:MAG TPA: hypothetical protein VIL51_12875 [Thermoleophilia bacterium]
MGGRVATRCGGGVWGGEGFGGGWGGRETWRRSGALEPAQHQQLTGWEARVGGEQSDPAGLPAIIEEGLDDGVRNSSRIDGADLHYADRQPTGSRYGRSLASPSAPNSLAISLVEGRLSPNCTDRDAEKASGDRHPAEVGGRC